MANTLLSNIVAPTSIVTLGATQTLTNKTLSSPSLGNATLTGTLTAGGSAGSNGYILTSTGTGVQWQAPSANSLDGLSDVVINAPEAQQVLKFNGTQWINADPDTAVASAVFAPNVSTDLGFVTDLILTTTEDLGFLFAENGDPVIPSFLYDMGQLKIDGIVSLRNIDQSVKADYISYSIIFGF
jgi:hypothetical protein